jgi:hypothetical protein
MGPPVAPAPTPTAGAPPCGRASRPMSLVTTLGELRSSEDDRGDNGARISHGQYLPLPSTTERLSSERHGRRHTGSALCPSLSLRLSGGSWSDERDAAGSVASGDDQSSCINCSDGVAACGGIGGSAGDRRGGGTRPCNPGARAAPPPPRPPRSPPSRRSVALRTATSEPETQCWCRRSERTATHEVMDRPCPQEARGAAGVSVASCGIAGDAWAT